MSRSADDLIYEAAGILGNAVPGEALGQVEYDIISKAVDSALATISRIVSLNRNDIPDDLFKTVADLVATFSAARFSQSEPDIATVEALENRLKVLVAPPRTRRTLRVDPAFSPYRGRYYR